MSTNKQAFTMRMQPDNFYKIKALAAKNKRSLAMQIEYLVENYIDVYEKQNGAIPLPVELAQNKNAVNVNGDNNVIGNIGDNGVAIMKAF